MEVSNENLSGGETPTNEVVESQTENTGTEAADTGGDSAEVEETPEYKPNYSYKVSKQEKEFPEYIRSAIKDATTEKEIRDLYERAEGLHDVKFHRDTLLKEIHEQYKPSKKILDTANSYLQSGDLKSYFEYSGVSDDDIFKYALKMLELRENPEQHKAYEQSRQLQLENARLKQQYDSLQSGYNQTVVSQREQMLDNYLSQPEIVDVVEAYNAQAGNPNAFKNEVIRRGQYYEHFHKVDQSIDQLVNEIATPLRGFMAGRQGNYQGAPNQPRVTPNGVVTGVEAQRSKATLPRVQGRGGSPVKKVPKSLAELRKIASEM